MCAGNPRRVSCAIEILSFQNFYRVLKTDSAGRKDFFDALSQGGVSIDTPPCFFMPCLRETVIHYINNVYGPQVFDRQGVGQGADNRSRAGIRCSWEYAKAG